VVEAGEALFTEVGFRVATIDDIASAAGVTKGAVYHHFGDKAQLFRTVVERLLERVGERLVSLIPPEGGDVWSAVCAAYQARVDLVVSDPAYRRIVDQDAAAVLGVRDLDLLAQEIADAALIPVIERAISDGIIQQVQPARLARMMGALISAACREVAAAPDPAAARTEVGETVNALLQGLRAT
jgi:AcrR family transcriptional regulator